MIAFAVLIGLILLSGLCTVTAAPYEYDAQVRALQGDLGGDES